MTPDTSDAAYPVPAAPPAYRGDPRVHAGRRLLWSQVVGDSFAVVGFATAVWLVVLLVRRLDGPFTVLNAVVCWLALTYVVLPRVHQLAAAIYVPAYFVGRTRTPQGLLGDPVDVALCGTSEDVRAAFELAGWRRAEPLTIRSGIGIVVSAVLRRPDRTAPVSSLLLFGCTEDVAYEREVAGSAAHRHHVRLWRTPEQWRLPGGTRVDWLAAATYDRGVGLSWFTLQVTHKIAADVDAERDFVVESLRYAVPTSRVQVLRDFTAAFHARNGGGDRFVTDGHLPIVDLAGTASHGQGESSLPLVPPDPQPDAVAQAMQQPLAPRPVLLALALTLVEAVAVLMGGGSPLSLACAGVGVACGVLVVARPAAGIVRGAWFVSLALATLHAFALLADASRSGGEINTLLTVIAVMVVVLASDDQARRWVWRGAHEGGVSLGSGVLGGS